MPPSRSSRSSQMGSILAGRGGAGGAGKGAGLLAATRAKFGLLLLRPEAASSLKPGQFRTASATQRDGGPAGADGIYWHGPGAFAIQLASGGRLLAAVHQPSKSAFCSPCAGLAWCSRSALQ